VPAAATLPSHEQSATGADVTARDERFDATALEWARWSEGTDREAVVAYLESVT